MLDFINFLLSKSALLPPKTEIERINFVLSRVFPPDNTQLALKRALNLALTYIAWKKGVILNNLKPVILQIESVKGCNFNCIMCRAGEFPKKFIDIDKLKTILDKFQETIFVIFTWVGEPFLSKDILDMIKYMSFERKLLVTMFSNFSILPDPVQIINSGLYEINASIDSFNPEKFSKIREWGNLDKVISNLKKLISTRNKLNRKIPIISINAVSTKETISDAEDIIKNAIELGVDRVKFAKLVPSNSEDIIEKANEKKAIEFGIDKEKFLKLVSNSPRLTEPDEEDFKYLKQLKEKYKNKIKIHLTNFEWGDEPPYGYCFFAYFTGVIDVSGKIYPCCFHYPVINNAEFGNLFYDDKVNESRQKLLKNFRKQKPNFCSNCAFYFRK